MATPYQVKLTPEDTGLLKLRQTDAVASKVSELVQKDLETHHVYFNDSGFHNHIVHQQLTLYGTGGSTEDLERAWHHNASYQLPAKSPHDGVADELRDWTAARRYLGQGEYYPDFLLFFQREIERLGPEQVVMEHLFRGDERATDLLIRLHGGFLHPAIHLMFGLEFAQPAVVAEALAQAAVHPDDLRDFLLSSERQAVSDGGDAAASPPPPSRIADLVAAVRDDPALAGAARFSDDSKIRDGVMGRARDAAVALASRVRVRVPPEGDGGVPAAEAEAALAAATAEMFAAAVAIAAGAAIREGKRERFDFFLIHHVNSAPMYLTINALPWIPTAVKARLLEWKIRIDLIQYAARGAPPLPLDEVAAYVPRSRPLASPPAELLPLVRAVNDDGHSIKLARAVTICYRMLKDRGYVDEDWLMVKGDDAWVRIQHMVVDSVTDADSRFVRSAGFDEAWKDVPAKASAV